MFSITALNLLNDSKIIYDPSVIVYHKVHEYRQTLRYMIKRSYSEGIAKARISLMCKNNTGNNALSTENNYLKYLFITAIPAYMKNIIARRDIISNMRNIILLFIVIFSVGIGYISEKK